MLRNGMPVTHKEDANYHGYGMLSIKTIAEQYGGELSIQAEGGLFSQNASAVLAEALQVRRLPYIYFLIPSVAVSASAEMVIVNFKPFLSLNRSTQSRNASIWLASFTGTTLLRLSIKMWVMS